MLEIVGWLYGERGAPKAWRETLLRFLLGLTQFALVQSTYDADILFGNNPTALVIIILFVDDIWLFCQRSEDAHTIINLLRKRFKCTEPEWLCGRGDGPWAVATSLSGAPTFCAVSVYFTFSWDGELSQYVLPVSYTHLRAHET